MNCENQRGLKAWIAGKLKVGATDSPSSPLTLLLHIGLPKTGTTAIQHFLHHNREPLRSDQRIMYPECGIPVFQHAAFVKSMVNPMFPWAHFSDMIERVEPESYLAEIVEQCRVNRYRQVVMSSEFFWAAPAMQAGLEHHTPTTENYRALQSVIERCRELFSVFERVKIIVYLRRQEAWFDSFFNQQIKDGFPIPDSHELASPKNYLLYHQNLEFWSDCFGRENVIVRFYEDVTGDVVDDFCHVAGIEQDKRISRPPANSETVNPRLSSISLSIMQKALKLELDDNIRMMLQDILRHTSTVTAGMDQKRCSLFPKSFYDEVGSCYREDNLKLSRIYQGAKQYLEPWDIPTDDNATNSAPPRNHEQRIELVLQYLFKSMKED